METGSSIYIPHVKMAKAAASNQLRHWVPRKLTNMHAKKTKAIWKVNACGVKRRCWQPLSSDRRHSSQPRAIHIHSERLDRAESDDRRQKKNTIEESEILMSLHLLVITKLLLYSSATAAPVVGLRITQEPPAPSIASFAEPVNA